VLVDFEPFAETVELEGDRFVGLEGERRWPRYVLTWSLRQRQGDSDYPLADGEEERMPPADGDLEAMWQSMREAALAAAQTAVAAERPQQPPRRSLLSRLFGRS
jgi:hypothetical protein